MATPTNHDLNVALTTRYLTLTGIVLLLHDHVTSLGQERRLVWRGPRSFTNYAFLFNRYLVPPLLVFAFVALGGFAGLSLSNGACWSGWIVEATFALLSLAIGNGVVTGHIIRLWEDQKLMKRVLWSGYAAAYLTSALTMIFAFMSVHREAPPIIWDNQLNSCVVIQTSKFFILTWAIPLAYECLLLGGLIWNTIDRPRQSHVTLSRALRNDGILYLTVLVLVRAIQTALVSTQNPNYLFMLLLFMWAVVTMTLSRSFLSMRQEEGLQRAMLRSRGLHESTDSRILYIGQWKETHRDDTVSSSSH